MMSEKYFEAINLRTKLENLLKGLRTDFDLVLKDVKEHANKITVDNRNTVELLSDLTKRLATINGRIGSVEYLYNGLNQIIEQFVADTFKEASERTAEGQYFKFVSGSIFQNTIDSQNFSLKI